MDLWTDFCVPCKLIKLLILGLDGPFEVMYITPQYLIEILFRLTAVCFLGEKPRTEKNLFQFFATNTYNLLIYGTSCAGTCLRCSGPLCSAFTAEKCAIAFIRYKL